MKIGNTHYKKFIQNMLSDNQISLVKQWIKSAEHYRFFERAGCCRLLTRLEIPYEINSKRLFFYDQAIRLQKHPARDVMGVWTARLALHLTIHAELIEQPKLLIDPDCEAVLYFCKQSWNNT